MSNAAHFQTPSNDSITELLSTFDTPEILTQERSFEVSQGSVPDTPQDITESLEDETLDDILGKLLTPEILSERESSRVLNLPEDQVISDTEAGSPEPVGHGMVDEIWGTPQVTKIRSQASSFDRSHLPEDVVVSDSEACSLTGLEEVLRDNLSIHEDEEMFLVDDDHVEPV
jgi:hypothetical protein